jgi:aminoglycoside phosphotransferase (APT) family kinase protein
VVEIVLPTNGGSHSLIGKVYAKDRSDVYTLMEEISRAGFGSAQAFSIPQPVAYLRDLQLLLQEKVDGQPATESFLSEDESERAAAAQRCGQWLAKFHAIAPRLGRRFQLPAYLVSIEKWFQRLAALGEPFADKAGRLFKQLEIAASALEHTEYCTIHGDFTHHQMIFAQTSTVTVDWDNYALADPSRDLARFMVGLKRLALRRLGSIRALDNAAEVFLKSYAAMHHADRARQLAFQKAAICLEHAKHDVHKQAGRWRERAEVTLDEGLRILELGA